jgi:hypothetical protein
MQQPTEILLAVALRDAKQGVEYRPGEGAYCPWCGQKLRVMDAKRWAAKTRIRYHICANNKCPLCSIDQGIKSIEVAENMKE